MNGKPPAPHFDGASASNREALAADRRDREVFANPPLGKARSQHVAGVDSRTKRAPLFLKSWSYLYGD